MIVASPALAAEPTSPENQPAGSYRIGAYCFATNAWAKAIAGSQPFTVSGLMTVTAPARGEAWSAGSRHDIVWTLGAPVASGHLAVWTWGNGEHTDYYRAADNVGNVLTQGSFTGGIDSNAPDVSVDGVSPDWQNGPVDATISASDADSGVKYLTYRLQGDTTWTMVDGASVMIHVAGDGEHTYEYQAEDNAGNLSDIGSFTVKIDSVDPTITQSGADDAWHPGAVSVTLQGSDDRSGVASVEYRADSSGPWTTVAGASTQLTISGDGSQDYEYRSRDNAGNLSTVGTFTVKIDTTAPQTFTDVDPTVWYAMPKLVNLTAGDAQSGVLDTEYSLDGGATWQAGTVVTLATQWKRGGGSGVHEIMLRSTDVAGNVETPITVSVLIDTSPPTSSCDAPTTPQSVDTTVHFSGHDAYAPVGQFWYSVDNGAWTQGSSVTIPAPANGSNDGMHTIRYYAVDNVGNRQVGYNVCTVIIGANPPTVTVPNGDESWNVGTTHDLTWTTSAAVTEGSFRVYLDSSSLGTSELTSSPLAADGTASYTLSWTIPAGQAVATDYRVRVVYTIAGVTAASDASDQSFAIIAADSTIAVNDFAEYRVFQRDIGGTSKSLTISGTYANMDWSRIEARVLWHGTNTAVLDWTTIDATPGGGTFSGNLTVPQGGWYDIDVRALDAAGSVIGSSRGTNKWGVGMIILVIGQSNMSGRGQPPFAVATSDLAVNYSNAGVWEHLADPYDDESPPGAVDEDVNAGGSMIPGIANSLLQTFDFPVAFVPAAKTWTDLYESNHGWAYRNPANHLDTSTLYGQSITKAQSVGGVELIIMHQGERDLSDGRTEAQYEADFATMIGHYRQDLYANIPIFICQLGTVGAGTNAGATGIRNAQHDVDNGTNVFMGATAMDLPRIAGDTWHYNTPALAVIGSRLANAILYYFGESTYYRGPSIDSVFFSDGNRNQVIVTLAHRGGSDITPATGITGFAVLDNGSNVTISSAVRYAADAVRLTLSRSILAGHTVTLRYLYGTTPTVSGLVKDNSPLALPLENTTANVTVTQAPDQPMLLQPANGATGVSTSANLEVAVSDPDGDELTVTFYGRQTGGSLLDGDFTIIAMPDTQHYTDNPTNYANFSAQTQWIVANRASRDIVFVTGLGDVVENGNTNLSEWQVADGAYSLLEDPLTTVLADGIPYGLAVGNHDQSPNGGGSSASTSLFNQFFGLSRFTGRSYYGGHYGTDNDNNYELFSAGGMDFIIIHFEYDTTPEQAVLDWADGLLTTYANRRAIITSHYMINVGNPGSWSAQGQAIYNALSDHPNLFLMLGGHMHGEGQRQDTAVNGNVVSTLLSDYQDYANGGDGWLRIMTFSPASDTIQVQTYSPTRNGGSGEFQTDADSQFTLSYDMPGGAAYQVIGTSTGVPSGSTTSVSWPGLEYGAGYQWHVTLDDGNAVTTGSTWDFTTTDPPTSPNLAKPFVWTKSADQTLAKAVRQETSGTGH